MNLFTTCHVTNQRVHKNKVTGVINTIIFVANQFLRVLNLRNFNEKI